MIYPRSPIFILFFCIASLISDGDGALTALAVAAKLLRMQTKGDFLEGDVFVSTHVCPDAPTVPHEPVPFMNSPVETWQVNKEEVTDDCGARMPASHSSEEAEVSPQISPPQIPLPYHNK